MDIKASWRFARKIVFGAVIISLFTAQARVAKAHTCPPGATATGVGLVVTALRTNLQPIGAGSVGPCEPFIVQMAITYFPFDPVSQGTNAAFEAGQMFLSLRGVRTDVTPGAIPLMGPVECGGTNVTRSLQIFSTVTPADATAGLIPINAAYTNGNAHIGETNLNQVVSASQGFELRVRPNVVCTATSSVAQVCAGGSVTFGVSATNGTAPYTFAWTGPGGFTATGSNVTLNPATPANSGVFRVVVTDFFGCTNVCEVPVTVNPQPICSIAPPVSSVCAGSAASFTVTPSGGLGPYSVAWTGPAGFTSTATNITITNAQAINAGIYRVVVTDARGCTNFCTAQLIVNPDPLCVITPPTNSVCAGSAAAFTVVPSAGTAPYTFAWQGPGGFSSTNSSISIPIAQTPNDGVYTVVVRDANGCITTCQARLIVNPNPVCTIAPITTGVCASATATFSVVPSGGTAPYRVQWSGPAGFISTNLTISINNAQAVNAGFYRAVVIDANGCTNFCQAQLNVFPNPVCTVAPATNSVCVGFPATFTAAPSGGTAPYRFAWSGPASFTSTNASITIDNAQLVNAGFYVVVVTDANGCTTTCQGRLIVNPNPICGIQPPTTGICAGATATFTVTPSGGAAPYRVQWNGPAGFTSSNLTISINNAQSINAGFYRAVVTDANGCTNFCQAQLNIFPNPTCAIAPPLAEICAGFPATFTVIPTGGTPPYRFNWSGPAGLTSTNATITIDNATAVNAGFYTNVVIDANGCTTTCEARLIVNPNPVCVIAPATNELCVGSPASFTVTPSGGTAPYRVAWTGPGNFTSTNLTITLSPTTSANAGLYRVMVTDAEGCINTCEARLILNPNPACAIVPPLAEVCAGLSASFTVNPSGGTAPYSFSWRGPGGFVSTNQTIVFNNAQPALSGTYTNVVTDARGCTAVCTAQLTVNPNPICTIAPTPIEVCAGNSATFTASGSGGTAPYTFTWTGPGLIPFVGATLTIPNAQPANSGVYRVVVRDAEGCTNTCTATLTVNPNPICTITPATNAVCQGASASFTVVGSSGTAPYTYAWSGPGSFTATGPTINIPAAAAANAGIYRVVMTDAEGCTNTCQARLIVNPIPVCAINVGATQICVGAALTMTATGSSGTAPYTFTWSGPGAFSFSGPVVNIPAASTNASGTYVVVVRDANGCTNTCSVTIRVIECEPRISVTKEVVCLTPEGCAPFTGADSAIGVSSGGKCPAFCYRITVANTSQPGIALEDLVVTDSELNLSSCSFPNRLGPVGSPTASATCVIMNVTHCQSTTNTVTARAVGVFDETGTTLQPVQTNDTTRVEVVPIAIVCDKFVSSPADLDLTDGPSTVTLPSDAAYPVTYGVAISNASTVPLVVFVSDPVLANCPLPAEFSNGVSIAAGQTLIWPSICVANLQCGVDPLLDQLVNTIVAEAVVDTSLTNICTYAQDGAEITASTTCDAIVRCSNPAGCRVTGGGRQDASTSRGSLVFPLQGGGIDCAGDLTVRYVTHGGQVGAPVGRTSEFDPDSECIQGNWEHVRHAQGGRRANFHAKSFDSLMCACLGDGSEPGVVVGELCNPDDKKGGLGPQPRRAPANKIAFSGVGDYTCNKGARERRSVLFRVDIEDRSEPGGFHPGGAKDPADRYRIRIWVLNAQELAALGGSANSLNDPFLCDFRRAIAATTVNTPLTDGAITASGEAVPLGTAVFGVRAPDVDDGGEMLHGNHQIHPQIKDCTKPVHVCPAQP